LEPRPEAVATLQERHGVVSLVDCSAVNQRLSKPQFQSSLTQG
jgi:hypothetical protein